MLNRCRHLSEITAWPSRIRIASWSSLRHSAMSHAQGSGGEIDFPPQLLQSVICCWAGLEAETIRRRQRKANISAPPGDLVMRRRAAFHEPANENRLQTKQDPALGCGGIASSKFLSWQPIPSPVRVAVAVKCGINLIPSFSMKFSTQEVPGAGYARIRIWGSVCFGPCRMTTAPQWVSTRQYFVRSEPWFCDARNVRSQLRKLDVKES